MKSELSVARGPWVSALLGRFGIDARRYWLLIDLFDLLSERGEVLDQLGANRMALRAAGLMYAAMAALMCVPMVALKVPLAAYFPLFLVITAFLLLMVLLSEAGNSLVNPAESLILAHQPIDDATYSAAKLTHLARIVLCLVPLINGLPALAGLALKDATWFYPVKHILGALAVGFTAALLSCALYGWLIRFLPPARLKGAAQLASTAPMLGMLTWHPIRDALAASGIPRYLGEHAAAERGLWLALAAGAIAAVAIGMRSLSRGYLIRVSGMTHGRAASRAGGRRSRIWETVARLFGGQAARAGSAYVWQVARRDFQFRRAVVPMLVAGVVGLAPLAGQSWRRDPFSGGFSMAHLLPHVFGFMLFFICAFLPYGNDFKAAWVFLLAPAQAFSGFARGIYAALWIRVIMVPHAVMFLLFAWPWGLWQAGLFTAYSAAAASVYLALELRSIDCVPFSRQLDPARTAVSMALMLAGAAVMAIAVGVQYFFVFRSAGIVAAVTVVLAAAAYFLTRSSLGALESSMRYNLGLLSEEAGMLYREVNV